MWPVEGCMCGVHRGVSWVCWFVCVPVSFVCLEVFLGRCRACLVVCVRWSRTFHGMWLALGVV